MKKSARTTLRRHGEDTMFVFRKKPDPLKPFSCCQYRKEPWTSWNRWVFRQTTALLCGASALTLSFLLQELPAYWLVAICQAWYSGLPQLFPGILWRTWLPALYPKDRCRRGLSVLVNVIWWAGCAVIGFYLLYNLVGIALMFVFFN